MNRSGSEPRDGVDRVLAAVSEAIERLRPQGDARADAPRAPIDARSAVLGVLAEQPASGYRIVEVLAERGEGERTPGAGAVYPTLQLLADEGLVTADRADGTRTWTLTAAGRAAAEAAPVREERREAGPGRPIERRTGIARSGAVLAQAVALAVQTARPDQAGEIVAVLDDARRRVLAILARS